MNWTALLVFLFFFLLITVLGFYASRWRRGDLNKLDEWGLAGRRFGTIITWFLIGGDIYTAYTFIAVPAGLYAKGFMNFFALPYTIIVYPFIFLVMPRMWSVARKHGFITAADFVKARYGSSTVALVVAITGILATMPYIALQLVGMQAVLDAMGWSGDVPLIIAFIILAVYTYSSGLRAPTIIAVVKDMMIYITVIAAVIYIPYKLGGFGHIFDAAQTALQAKNPPASILPAPRQYMAYSTLALGSALALFLYPHSLIGVFSAKSRDVIRRNAALLPLYSFVLGIIALLGYMAIAAGVKANTPNDSIPQLFLNMFPDWFAGFAFAAVGIGALVPAAIMSIAASNLFTRNIYKEYFNKNCTDKQESSVAKIVSLVVKFGALLVILVMNKQDAINYQLFGGIWILQTLPAIILGLYTGWFNKIGLVAGWAVGIVYGTWAAYHVNYGSLRALPDWLGGSQAYIGLQAVVLNLLVAVVLTLVLRAAGMNNSKDETHAADYEYEGEGDAVGTNLPPAALE